MGYVNQTIAISQPIVEKFLSLVLDGDDFSEEVVMWMYNHVQFLTYCGGFEITRMYFYTDADERDSVQSFIGGISVIHMPESVIENSGRKTSFRDMVERLRELLNSLDSASDFMIDHSTITQGSGLA